MEKTVLPALTFNDEFYWARVDRNIGWLTAEEQAFIRTCKVGIAGTGGMGGIVGAILARCGVGAVAIADNQAFDASNINRQFAARQDTIGKNKAEETAKEIQRITDDVGVEYYPGGISEETASDFVKGKNVVLDEIEFFAPAARIKLHQEARREGVPVLNCNTVGFSMHLFYYTPDSMTVEEALGLTYEEALELEKVRTAGGEAGLAASRRMSQAVMRAFVPDLPSYRDGDHGLIMRRLVEEGKASIMATNPPMASGFVSDQVVFELLRQFGSQRPKIVQPPKMPGYFFFDAGGLKCLTVTDKWW